MLEQNQVRHDFLDSVSGVITDFLSRKNKSYRYLESKAGVSKSYILRLQRKEITVSQIDVFKLYLILKIILGPEKAKDFLSATPLKEKFNKIATPLGVLSQTKMIDQEDVVFRNQENYITFSMASCHGGTSEEMLCKALGERALFAACELVDANIIELKNGKYSVTDSFLDGASSWVASADQCLRVLKYSSDYYNSNKKSEGRNLVFAISQNVSDEFLRKSKSKLAKVLREIFEDSKKTENKGNLPFFLVGAMDIYANPDATISNEKGCVQ